MLKTSQSPRRTKVHPTAVARFAGILALAAIRTEEHHDGAVKIVQDLPVPAVLLVYVRPQ